MICQFCGKEFEPIRKTAKFCTNKCRIYFNRGIKENKKDLDNLDSVTKKKEENVVSVTNVMDKLVSVTKLNKIQPIPKTLKVNKIKKAPSQFDFCPYHNVFYHSCGCKE